MRETGMPKTKKHQRSRGVCSSSAGQWTQIGSGLLLRTFVRPSPRRREPLSPIGRQRVACDVLLLAFPLSI
jgi:hypothetical protein